MDHEYTKTILNSEIVSQESDDSTLSVGYLEEIFQDFETIIPVLNNDKQFLEHLKFFKNFCANNENFDGVQEIAIGGEVYVIQRKFKDKDKLKSFYDHDLNSCEGGFIFIVVAKVYLHDVVNSMRLKKYKIFFLKPFYKGFSKLGPKDSIP